MAIAATVLPPPAVDPVDPRSSETSVGFDITNKHRFQNWNTRRIMCEMNKYFNSRKTARTNYKNMMKPCENEICKSRRSFF